MIKLGTCSFCFRPVVLTKNGLIFRHGWKNYARNKIYLGFTMKNNYSMVETRSACPGSGFLPHTNQLSQDENKSR